jgi:hypothetical protein
MILQTFFGIIAITMVAVCTVAAIFGIGQLVRRGFLFNPGIMISGWLVLLVALIVAAVSAERFFPGCHANALGPIRMSCSGR